MSAVGSPRPHPARLAWSPAPHDPAPTGPTSAVTLVAWCEGGFHLVHTSQALHIHRNTLLYRLEKIERLTGRPWRDHRATLTLYLACQADQLR